MEKFSLTDIKKINYADVYHFIYQNESCSKQAISKALQMSLPTVSQHINSLIDDGLIEKCGQLQSQIGRRAAAYSIVPRARVSVGVEILGDRVLIAALDLYGEEIGQVNLSANFCDQPEYFQTVCHAILAFIQTLSLQPEQILGVGFGIQGLVSQDEKEIIYGKILECTGLHIDAFQRHLPFPCRFIHDSECAALSDLWRNPGISDALYLSIGHHLGGAVIFDGKVSSGRTGRSGTFEHMTLVPGGLPCYCGQNGCAECYCSVQALLKEGEDLERYFAAKEAGDLDALSRWDAFLGYLAMAINNLHMVVDSNIVLGGHITPYLSQNDIAELHRRVEERTAFPENEQFILAGQRRKHAVALGAGLPYISEFLTGI